MKSKKPDSKTYDEAYDMRVKKGILPTIEIAGHTFYVDIRMNKLRPKDDFLSNGISFCEIEDYLNEEKEVYITLLPQTIKCATAVKCFIIKTASIRV